MQHCLFCNIAARKIKSEIVYEDDQTLVFKDIHPKRPIHWLIIPKKHVANLNELKDTELAGYLFTLVGKLAKKHGFAEDGYRVIVNTNAHGGQEVDHLHVHILAGRHAGPMIIN